MDYKKIIRNFLGIKSISSPNRKCLLVLLGSFADFDSFEYGQELSHQSEKLAKHSIDLIVVGIGTNKSKELFCRFNKLDTKSIFAVSNADLHNKLQLNHGLTLPFPAIFNLLIMCVGINSKGTLKEVLRGYLGDTQAKKIFTEDEDIKIGSFPLFRGKLFDVFSSKDILRPFELATRRLLNMIEILFNWNIYVPDASFLTQRGATIFLNENDEVLYKFVSESLLGYSENMSRPLSFLDDYFID